MPELSSSGIAASLPLRSDGPDIHWAESKARTLIWFVQIALDHLLGDNDAVMGKARPFRIWT